MEMKKYRLGEIGKICMCKRILKEQTIYDKTQVPFYKIGTFGGVPDVYISRDLFNEYKSKFSYPARGAILISAAGTIGRLVKFCGEESYFQDSNIVWIDNNEKVVLNEYLYYLLKNISWQPSKGSTILRLYNDDIRNKEVCVPSLLEQKHIASVLSSLDRKIALNRQINDNLEAMAKQLYDYWFVQFDFPNEDGKPYKSSGGKMVWNEKLKRVIPEGWEVKSIFNALSVQYGFPFSTDLFTEEITQIPIVRIRDILNNSISAYTTEQVDDKYLLCPKDLLIGMDGNFHMNYWDNSTAYLNQRSVRLRPTEDSAVSIIQARYEIAPFIKAKELRAKGSTVGHLSDKDLKELYVVDCHDYNIKERFDSILNMIILNRQEIKSLTKERNELLPLLINGQVTIAD